MNKEHKDPYEIDLEAPRLAWYKQKKWRRHQDTVCWVDIQHAQQKRLKFNQTRSNAIILYNTLPAYCIPKATQMETGEIIYEKVYESPRPPPKNSLRNNWMKELGPEVAREAEGSQPTQPNPNHLLRENKSSRRIHRWQLDIPNNVIKKRRPRGNRHGKTEEQRQRFIAQSLRKRCIKKSFEGIHDRLQKDSRFRDSQLRIDRTEEICIQMDGVAQKDFTYCMSSDEFFRYKKNWWISLTYLDEVHR